MHLIIGAGITGLSYASLLKKNDYLIIESDKEIGGYCKTIKQDGFIWDYSGHFFHFQNSEIKSFLLENISTEIKSVLKQSQIFYKDRYIDYPFQKNIHQLEKNEFIDCLYDLFIADSTLYSSFKEMLYVKFGKSIAEKFLIPYNQKLYACDLNELDPEAMGRFFPYANKEEIIKNFRESNNLSYNSHFTYPSGGAIEYVKSIYKRLDPDKINLEEKLISVDIKNKIAYTNKSEIAYDKLVSTIPFPRLLACTNFEVNENIYSWNKVLVFNIGFDSKGKDKINHWVYFPENDYCFYRIGYYDNIFSDNRMSLYVELGFQKDELINEDLWIEKVLCDLKKVDVISDQKVISYSSIIMDPAYVHINKNSIADVKTKKDIMRKHNIYSIGRYGSWTYCSIEDNIIEARNLISEIDL